MVTSVNPPLPPGATYDAPSQSNDTPPLPPGATYDAPKEPKGKSVPSFSETLEGIADRASAAGRGVVKMGVGGPGEIEKFVFYTVPQASNLQPKGTKHDMGFGRETIFPTMSEVEQVLQYGEKAAGRRPGVDPRYKKYETAGEFLLPGAQLAPTVTKLATKGASKIGELLGVKQPELGLKPSTLREMGTEIGTTLESKVNAQYAARQAEAAEKYGDAIQAARKTQVEGTPFAQSDQGRALIDSLERSKLYTQDGKTFQMGEEQVAGINRLINAIKGTTTGGEVVPVGKGVVSSTVTKKLPSVTTEKDINALIEELRFLREPNAKGKPSEAYAALSDKYKGQLAEALENALYSWNDKYRLADEAYKAASQKLNVFKTELMSSALRGEKFDFKQMAADPETLATQFFKSQDTVKQLKTATGDPAAVDNLAKQYAATILENKTPKQISDFVNDVKNEGWLTETGLKDKLAQYANQATGAESRQKILKWLGALTGAGAVGGALTKTDLNRLFNVFP